MSEKKSRTFCAIKNMIFNFMYQIVNIITNIIIPPIIINKFGSTINGLVSTTKQIMNYIQLVGAGISESTVVSLYKPLANNNSKKISEIFKASGKTFFKAGTFFSVLALCIAFIYPLFVKEDLEYDFIVKIFIILSVSGMSEFFVIGKYRTLLIADQKAFVVNIAQIVGALISTILTIVLIKLNLDIVWVQLVATLAYIGRIIVLSIYVKRNYKYIDKSCKPDYSAVAKRKDATIHQIASLIIFGSQTIFISNFCGLAEASVYSVYNLIFTGINTVLSTVSSAMLAGMGNLLATGDNEKINKIFDIYEFLYYILVFIFYITTYLMMVPFIKIYIGETSDVNYIRPELVILFIIMGILNCLRTPGGTMINAKGHYKETRNRAIIEMSICLVLEICLTWKLGIVGVLIATICAYLYRSIDVIIYNNKKILKRPIKYTLKKVLINLILISIILLCFRFSYNTNSYFEWTLYAFITVIVTAIIVILVNSIFNKNSAKETLQYIKCFFRRKKKND